MIKKRAFLKSALAGSVLCAFPLVRAMQATGEKKLNVLFMGGTGFIGPHIVRALLGQGHKVTLFNRGRSNPGLFKELDHIQGDRLTSDLKKVSHRKWDLIIDTSSYVPRAVNMLMDAVDRGSVQQYVFISTVSVYEDFTQKGLHEGSKLATMEDPASEDVSKYYGALKALCEQAAEKAMPGRVTRIRCGLIIGPGDSTDRFTYWPVRVARGGEVLAPGTGEDYLQTIDVRDLAAWVAHCVERKITGAYNSMSPAGRDTFRDLMHLCKQNLNSDARFTWASADFLKQQNVAEMSDLPLWSYPDGDYSAIWQVSSERALGKGLKNRSLAQSIVDTHEWFQTLPEERKNKMRAGMSLERERKILTAWHKNQKR